MKILLIAMLAACSSAAAPPTTTTPSKSGQFTPTAFSVKVSGAGRPVIFIPGLASPGNVWDGTVAHLGGKITAHVLTLAGFNGQPPIAAPFLQQVHDQVVQYIAANHLDHPIIIGHSLGGMMSLWLAETDPDIGGVVDVDGLPFLSAVMDPTMTSDKARPDAKAMHDQLAAATHDEVVAQMKQFLGSMVTDPAGLALLQAAAEKADGGTVANAFEDLMTTDLRADLPKIKVPVTIIAATESGAPRDKLEAGWHAQIDAIPHVDIHFVDKAKHFVMLDQPDAFYALVDQALVK